MRDRLRIHSNNDHPNLLPRATIAWAIICLLAIVWLLITALMGL